MGLRPDGIIVKPEDADLLKAHLAETHENQNITAAGEPTLALLTEIHEDDHTTVNAFLGSAQNLLQTATALHKEVKTQQLKDQLQAQKTILTDDKKQNPNPSSKREAEANSVQPKSAKGTLEKMSKENARVLSPAELESLMATMMDRQHGDVVHISTLKAESLLAQLYVKQWESLEPKLRAQGMSDTQIQAHQWLMLQSYQSQANALSPVYMPAAFPALVVATTSLMWWIYCATHETELAQTKEEVLTWVSGKTGLQKGTIEDIYQGGKLAVDMAQLVVGGLGKEIGKPLLKTVFKKTLRQDVPDALLQKAYDAKETRREYDATYGKENVQSSTVLEDSARGSKHAGQRHPAGVVFDQRGFPIFDDVAKFDTRIPQSAYLKKSSDSHMRAATLQLKEAIETGQISNKQFNDLQIEAIHRGDARVPGFVWHHHQDTGRMQLISEKIHEATPHAGGMKTWGEKK